MQIITYPLGQLKANCYFIINGNECLVIDPADEADFILEQLQRRKLKLVGLLATHGHFDHVMAAGEIQLSYPVPLYINEKDQFLLKRLEETARHFLEYIPVIIPPQDICNIKEGLFKVESIALNIIYTPGHTPGSCCFYLQSDQTVFTGDTLFKEAIGRYDFQYSNKIQLFESIEKILDLPEETIINAGHGDETTVGGEREFRQ